MQKAQTCDNGVSFLPFTLMAACQESPILGTYVAPSFGQLWNPFLSEGAKDWGTRLVQAWHPSFHKGWHAADTNSSMKQANVGRTLALFAKAKESAILGKGLGTC